MNNRVTHTVAAAVCPFIHKLVPTVHIQSGWVKGPLIYVHWSSEAEIWRRIWLHGQVFCWQWSATTKRAIISCPEGCTGRTVRHAASSEMHETALAYSEIYCHTKKTWGRCSAAMLRLKWTKKAVKRLGLAPQSRCWAVWHFSNAFLLHYYSCIFFHWERFWPQTFYLLELLSRKREMVSLTFSFEYWRFWLLGNYVQWEHVKVLPVGSNFFFY